MYWGRPVPGFGDPDARLLVLALAPAAHGANRTGRVFTGDAPGGSGDFLMRAMHAAGFANIPTSRQPATACSCATRTSRRPCAARRLTTSRRRRNRRLPPASRGRGAAPCRHLKVIVALGRIAFDAAWRLLADRGVVVKPKPVFGHGLIYRPPGGPR